MSTKSSLFRLIALLVMVALLAGPTIAMAQETGALGASDGPVAASESVSIPEEEALEEEYSEEGSPEEGTSEEGNSEEGSSEEGNSEEGNPEDLSSGEGDSGEGNAEDGDLEEGNSEEGNSEEGNSEEGAANEESVEVASFTESIITGDVSLAAEPGTGDPLFYCNFDNMPGSGDLAAWWAAEGVAPDCIDLEITNSPSTCSLSATFTSYVFWSSYRDTLAWYETDANGVVLRPVGGGSPLNWATSGPSGPGEGGGFTVTFPEDYNGGTAWVLINFGSPENQIAPGLDQIDLDHWRTTSAGRVYEINTDCEEPIPVNYCDYSQHVGAGDVYSWLSSAPEGANTDCIDVGEPVQVCGSLTIPFSEIVEPYTYVLMWAIGTEIPADDSLWNTTWPIVFEEDFNGGEVDVVVFIGGPEDDYYHFANEDPYPYPYPNQDRGDIAARSLGGGKVFTILTDCEKPADPEKPVDPDKPKPEKPKPEDKTPVATQLPNTGAGSSAGSMMELAAAAAAAAIMLIFGAGLFVTNRKR